jgi:branched-chain amino acid aminotransferase
VGEIVYLNGELVPTVRAQISVLDRGLLYGDGLFETIRVYNGTPFYLDAHLDRLFWGAKKLKMEIKLSKDHLKQAVYDTIQANDERDSIVRLTLTRGIATERMKISRDAKPTIIITCDDFKGYPSYFYTSGVDVITVTDSRSDLAMVKSLNFLPNVLAKHDAEVKGAFEALFVTRRGFVTEGSTSNVFAVLDGVLITPPLSEKILPGITRELVLMLARKSNMQCKEDAIMYEEISDAEEMFLTNSTTEIMPVATVDGKDIAHGHPGHMTRELHQKYKELNLTSGVSYRGCL